MRPEPRAVEGSTGRGVPRGERSAEPCARRRNLSARHASLFSRAERGAARERRARPRCVARRPQEQTVVVPQLEVARRSLDRRAQRRARPPPPLCRASRIAARLVGRAGSVPPRSKRLSRGLPSPPRPPPPASPLRRRGWSSAARAAARASTPERRRGPTARRGRWRGPRVASPTRGRAAALAGGAARRQTPQSRSLPADKARRFREGSERGTQVSTAGRLRPRNLGREGR